jgi:hypothetical protein
MMDASMLKGADRRHCCIQRRQGKLAVYYLQEEFPYRRWRSLLVRVTAVLSGMLGDWLVGLATAFLPTKARTLNGKFVGIALPVTASVKVSEFSTHPRIVMEWFFPWLWNHCCCRW